MEKIQSQNVNLLKSKVLFVEGMDEVNFFNALLKKIELDGDYQVVDFKGKSQMGDFISMMSKTESFNENVTSIAIIRDADNNFDSVANEIKYTLKSVFSAKSIENGEVKEFEDINIGFYIMPGPGKNGELEDLVLSSLQENEIFSEVCVYLEKLKTITKPANEQSIFSYPRKESKAKLQIYFSSMKESDPRMGLSAQRSYVDFKHTSFEDLIRFIKSM
ncbi:DUF3226 domain-containing protein [Enterobacter sp. CPE_E331]|uniref:DUF3226 domain-containing protein n=3 Tax=Enterobacter TaxID=547 RepID=UPI003976D22B